jgi:hypothetical protein
VLILCDGIFLSSVPRFLKEHYFLEGSQAWFLSLCGKSNMGMNMNGSIGAMIVTGENSVWSIGGMILAGEN